MDQETKFVNGLYSNEVKANAPTWILANQSIHVTKLMAWLTENASLANDKGYINITTKLSKGGKRYIAVDWRPSTDKEDAETDRKTDEAPMTPSNIEYPEEEINPADIPF